MAEILSLMDIYNLLFRNYGSQKWWPAKSPFEVVVGTILTQNTNWKNVVTAIKNLRGSNMLNPHNLYYGDINILKKNIRPAGFYNQKTIYLKNISKFIIEELNYDITNLRNYRVSVARNMLLNIKGIGFETADSILLYAVKKLIFVVDLYTKRFLARVRIPLPLNNYNYIQQYIMNNIDKDITLYNEFHALIVKHSKTFCRKKPLCDQCFLNSYCI
jgi:endonuclease-3 related protein